MLGVLASTRRYCQSTLNYWVKTPKTLVFRGFPDNCTEASTGQNASEVNKLSGSLDSKLLLTENDVLIYLCLSEPTSSYENRYPSARSLKDDYHSH